MLTINLMSKPDLQISQALQSLAKETRKYKSVEEFARAVAVKRTAMQVRQVRKGVGFADELIGGISQIAFSTEETIEQLEEFVKNNGYSSLTDFYNQTTTG